MAACFVAMAIAGTVENKGTVNPLPEPQLVLAPLSCHEDWRMMDMFGLLEDGDHGKAKSSDTPD
jgi:hypothetical protein